MGMKEGIVIPLGNERRDSHSTGAYEPYYPWSALLLPYLTLKLLSPHPYLLVKEYYYSN